MAAPIFYRPRGACHRDCIGALVGDCAPGEPVSAEPPPANLPRDVERRRGLTAAELARLLGEPDFLRADPPAVVWQYRRTDCVLDLFLYRSADEFRVAYAETHDRGLVRVSQSDCYADLIATRARPLELSTCAVVSGAVSLGLSSPAAPAWSWP